MKKKYKFTEDDQQNRKLEEPMLEYRTCSKDTQDSYYDIPEEYLLMRLKQAEKEIKEGQGIPHEEVIKRFLG